MTKKFERPDFLPSFLSALAEMAQQKKLWHIVVTPIVAGALGAGAAYLMPASFWSDDNLGVSATVYTGLLTLNGLILALSLSAFSRIYESISAQMFCAFLRRAQLLNKYIVTMSSVQFLQLFAVIMSATGLIVTLIELKYEIIDRIIFGLMIFASIYAIQKASSAISIMNDLLWQKSIFDEHAQNSGASTIVPLEGRNGKTP